MTAIENHAGLRGLPGKVAVVTGGGGGIGTAICERLAAEGAAVMVADRDDTRARAVADDLVAAGRRGAWCEVDVADPDQVTRMFDQAAQELGPPQLLVCAVGVSEGMDVETTDPRQWDRTLAVNAGSYFLCGRALTARLRPARTPGAIVFISSTNAFFAEPGAIAYTASKGAVDALTKCLALELARDGVRVNAVAPGVIRTPVTDGMLATAPDGPNMLETWNAAHALGRIGRPDEIASVVAFLASDEASFVTGATWLADGGLTCGWTF
jgi:NAD(P)-dependent dehydrogenase (short-subunit alcohol dehydrogenase family)